MKDFVELVDLAAERLGGSVLVANDEFFAEKENLLKAATPVFIDGKYTDRGKWMDGWETRRRRVPGHDWCIVRLGLPGVVRGVVIDTAFFKGNYPEHASLDGVALPGQPTPDELASADVPWVEILPKSKLAGDSKNLFAIAADKRFTHLRLHIHPDGGVARLRVHGDVVPELRWVEKPGALVDLASVENGGVVTSCNDMFFGSRHNLVMPGRSVNMGDGWETKRSRREGPDWVIVKLAADGVVERVEMDTNHFKGNFPESAALDGSLDGETWTEFLPRTKLQAHTRHFYDVASGAAGVGAGGGAGGAGPFTYVRMRIWPDGGVSRLRVWGAVTPGGREAARVRYLNLAPDAELARLLGACCGSTAWVRAMAATRPWTSLAHMKESAARAAEKLEPGDWLEAFRAHPRIGEKKTADRWAAGEQARVSDATDATRAELAKANAAYEAKFGHIYIVCATGKSAQEMLALCNSRLGNSAGDELTVAAGEQKKITDIRLEKLVTQ